MSGEPLSLTLLGLVLLAIVLDLLIGDPPVLPHPVVGMGRLIEALERAWNRGSPRARRLKGFLLVACVVPLVYGLVRGALELLARLHPWLEGLAELWLLASALAIKGLRDAALAVARPLARGDLETARQAVAMIVGRDTHGLDEAEVTRATVETVAENTVDGITAPLFWALLGGAPLALTYKAVNTLDSMVGHRNARHADFGYASARLDDLANWLPARLTALTMWLLAPSVLHSRIDWRRWRRAPAGTLRDAPSHPSPNAGWPESMTAWLLGVQLGGLNHYGGGPSRRATLGVADAPLCGEHISRAIALMHAGWVGFVLLMAGAVWLRGGMT